MNSQIQVVKLLTQNLELNNHNYLFNRESEITNTRWHDNIVGKN